MIYNPWFEAQGIDTVVVPMGCEAGDLAALLPALFRLRNMAGALITMPHKSSVVDLLDDASAAVKICGACNAVRRDEAGRLIGDMFDGEGFVRGVAARGRRIEGAAAIVIGNGGAGSAIAASLAAAGAARLTLHDTVPASSQRLAARLAEHYPAVEIVIGSNDPSNHDIVVNATPLGMADGDPLPVDVTRVDPRALVGDVVMSRHETPCLAAARAHGCAIQFGTDMLFEQIPAYLEFFGYPAATAQELRALARLDG